MSEVLQGIPRFVSRTQQFIRTIDVQPTEDEYRFRLRLMRQLLLFLMPAVASLFLVRAVVTIIGGEMPSTALVTLVLSLSVLGILYFMASTGHYTLTVWITLVLGTAAILATVAISSPPHMEIAYFAFLPLFGATMLLLRQSVLVNLLSILGLILFRGLFSSVITWDVFVNWLIFFCLLDAGFFLGTVHRLHLEYKRRQLEVEHNRLAIYRTILGNLNHDLRTPLAVIQSCSYLARETTRPEEQQRFLHQIDEQAHNLTSLVEKVLLLAELDSRDPEPPPLVDLVSETGALGDRMALRARQKSITFSLRMPELLHGRIHGMDWTSILGNLIENAIHYTAEGGTVGVQVTGQAGMVVVEVTDTGVGIQPGDLPHIFDYFYRADPTRPPSSGGTGLGLVIVKRQVDLYGGSITVDSQVGRGTTFRVHLPIARRE